MTTPPSVDDREIAEAVDSLDRQFSVSAAARLIGALERKHTITTTWTSGRTPCAIRRQVYCPRPETEEALATWLHECGHCLSGPCPDRPPHRRDATRSDAWCCLECENAASARALTLAPFSARMHQRLAAGMKVYLRTTPAPADATARARRFVDGASWREAVHRRTERQIRMDQGREIQAIASAPRYRRPWEIQYAEIQHIARGTR